MLGVSPLGLQSVLRATDGLWGLARRNVVGDAVRRVVNEAGEVLIAVCISSPPGLNARIPEVVTEIGVHLLPGALEEDPLLHLDPDVGPSPEEVRAEVIELGCLLGRQVVQ